MLTADPHLGAAHQAMAAQLTGPLAAGAADEPVDVDTAGRAAVPGGWEPLLLAAPAAPLREIGLRLIAVLDPDGAAIDLPPLDFAPWTEAGAFLPLHREQVDAATRTGTGFELALRVRELRPDGSTPLVPVAQTRNRVRLTVLHGVLGRALFLMGSEKARLRRAGRELVAAGSLDYAFADALDRHGADLGVARFADTLTVSGGQLVTAVARESDVDYRRRLAMYRPWLLPTRSRLLELLNGSGGPGDPNAGPLAELGVAERFSIIEQDNEFAVAVKIVGAGPGTHRANFLDYVRRTVLVWPRNNTAANAVHNVRFVPASARTRTGELRTALRTMFAFTADAATDPALAPALGNALVRLGRCRDALTAGIPPPWPLRRAQRADRGSRYELGLGADLAPLVPAELTALAIELANPNRPAADPVTESLLATMAPASPADDPDGRWLLQPCGLRTVHRLAGGDLYVSTLPTFGLAIDAPDQLSAAATVDVEAHYHAPGDPGANAVLLAALTQAAGAWTGAPWAQLDDTTARARWDLAQSGPGAAGARAVFAAAGLPAVDQPAPVVERLEKLPAELLTTVRLDPAFAAAIVAGDPDAIDSLRELAGVLEAAGLASVLPLVTGSPEVVLVVGVIGLPAAGVNLAQRRPTGFRWYTVPLGKDGAKDPGEVGAVGSRTRFRAPRVPSVTALVVLGYARRGLTDPYEHRVTLPDGTMLDPLAYEFTMNALDHCYPMGVEVNTYSLRRAHVDLDGDGTADPLDPSAARTYRTFRRRRHRGEAAALLEES